MPVLVMHSEDDQIVPYVAAGPLSAKLLKNGTLKTYKDFPHGMPTTQADTINADLLAFLRPTMLPNLQKPRRMVRRNPSALRSLTTVVTGQPIGAPHGALQKAFYVATWLLPLLH